VPPLTENATNAEVAPMRRLPGPEKVTVEPVAVNVATEEVSQLPVLIVMLADANVIVAGPLEVRLLAPKAMTPAFVNERVPVHVRDPLKVVEIAGLTVRLYTVCGTFTDPPEASTTIVDVPAARVPKCVSIDVTVIVDPLDVNAPPAFTFSVTALIARFEPPVLRVVVPAPPVIVSVPPMRSAFVPIVKDTVDAPELKVTFPPNS
jgi:hypothetical protein